MIAGIRDSGNSTAVGTLVHYLWRSPTDSAVSPRGIGQGVSYRIRGKVGRDVDICLDIGVRPGVSRRSVAPVYEVVISIRYCGNGGTTVTIIDGLGRSPGDTAVGPRHIGQGICQSGWS